MCIPLLLKKYHLNLLQTDEILLEGMMTLLQLSLLTSGTWHFYIIILHTNAILLTSLTMSTKIATSALLAAAILNGAAAFAPAPVQRNACTGTSLHAESGRREMLGNFAKALGAAGAIAVGATQSAENSPELLAGLTNPAGANFRGHSKGQSFTPGKGMRAHDDELIAGLTNPAGGNFRGKFKGQSFTPGKGMRNKSDDLC